MKIAIPEVMGKVNPHFGQSEYFLILDMEGTEIISINRISSQGLQHKYDLMAQMLQANQVDVVIVGSINQKGFNALAKLGFLVITGVKGDITAAATAYARGELTCYKYNCSRRCHKNCLA